MTKEQTRLNGEAMIAASQDKPVQYQWRRDAEGKWWDCGAVSWDFDEKLYRPKPEPKVRPWNCPADVPGPVCWLRESHNPALEMMVTSIWNQGISYRDNSKDPRDIYFGETPDKWERMEYSTDRKQWAPCTVTED